MLKLAETGFVTIALTEETREKEVLFYNGKMAPSV
jgi:hypothetical protein